MANEGQKNQNIHSSNERIFILFKIRSLWTNQQKKKAQHRTTTLFVYMPVGKSTFGVARV